MHTAVTTIEGLPKQNSDFFEDFNQSYLLSGVIKEFVDGILVLTETGNWVYANAYAVQILHRLFQGILPSNLVLKEILAVSQSLRENLILISKQQEINEAEIRVGKLGIFRVRTQWIRVENAEYSYLLVIIEDRYQCLQNIVTMESHKYELTPSEKKVWFLRRANYTNKQIAEKLQISINTVKKHMKNIHAKRKTSFQDEA